MLYTRRRAPNAEAHQLLAGIPDDDPELLAVLKGIKTPVLALRQIVESGPHGLTVVHSDINRGLLKTFIRYPSFRTNDHWS